MTNHIKPGPRSGAVICLFVLALITAALVLPFQLRSKAENARSVRSAQSELVNYDIRTDRSAFEKLAAYRGETSKSAAEVADFRDSMVRGEASLRLHIPTLKIEYNDDLRIPEVIATDVKQGKAFLTHTSGAKRSQILKDFLGENIDLIGARFSQISELKVAADYTNPDGNLSFVELNQEVNGVPVFRGEIKAGFTRSGEIIRVINNFAPGLDSVSTDFGDPAVAAESAAQFTNTAKLDLTKNEKASTELKAVFGGGSTTAEKMYFPTEPGVAVAAWRVLVWQPTKAYYVIVDAKTGTMLWRKNITEDQSQTATYNVYANPSAMVNIAQSPFPFSTGPVSPIGTQGNAISRTLVTRIGNEAPYTFNNLGWLTDGSNITEGNNAEAGLDRELPNASPANPIDIDPNGTATGSPNRVFDFPINPGIPSNPVLGMGDDPLPAGQFPTNCQAVGTATAPTNYQKAVVTQLFYVTNVYHDEMYRLGFTEAARNFQNNNFGRGGNQNDRVSAQAQDCNDVNNANFSTPADGTRPSVQMYLWNGPTPDYDGSLDATIVLHELTHGTSGRLHGNSSGLFNDMSRGMGEGFSDFYAHSMLSQPSDPIDGTYTIGAYATYMLTGSLSNGYYGVRRFPTAIKSAVGGLNSRPHNPLTFADIDSVQLDINDGAFPPRTSGNPDQVHNAGEIWCNMLWEVRARMITRLGWAVGNRKVLQLVTDGMKLAPLSPTQISERDAIIAAAVASGDPADVADMWAGFATRGLGASASIQNVGGISTSGTGSTRVTEAFDAPNLYQTPDLTVSDSTGDNDGFPEPGETVTLTIPLTNSTGTTATGVTLQVIGGGSANYGTMAGIATTSRNIAYTIPAGTPCGSSITISLNVTSSLGPVSFTRQTFIGKPGALTTAENFDGVTAPAIPSGWSATASQGGVNFVTTTISPDGAPNSAYALNPENIGGGTDLASPLMSVSSANATVSFRNRFVTESAWDGGVLEISVAGAPFQDILAAGGTFTQNGYNGSLGPGRNNPIANRQAWTGNSQGYITTIAQLPAAANGKVVQLKWRFGADDNTAGSGPNPGWNIDTITLTGAGFAGSFACSVNQTVRSRGDFDGDGKTDIAIYRPNDGNWWQNRSTLGLTVTSFGGSEDIPTPGDFDGDGKADLAVFRPSNGAWYRINSGNGSILVVSFGQTGDLPQAGDFDGDGKDDIAVFRPSTGVWYRINSSNGSILVTSFGQSGDLPVAGDYDGDGKDDIAVFRPSNGLWYRINSGNGQVILTAWGLGTDLPANADYDGDNRDDIAVYRPSDGKWYWINSSNGQVVVLAWGSSGDVPVPGDYNGDGKDDPSVYRAGTWYVNTVTNGFTVTQFGVTSDIPIPKKYIP